MHAINIDVCDKVRNSAKGCLRKVSSFTDVCVVLRRFRILNTVYRGHVTANPQPLARALKIIIHSNYMYTRDHPQRNHQPMDLELSEVDAAGAAPHDPELGAGYSFADFNVGDLVQVWHARTWWHGKITYKSRSQTLSVRMVGSRDAITGILPKDVKPAAEE